LKLKQIQKIKLVAINNKKKQVMKKKHFADENVCSCPHSTTKIPEL